MRLVTFQSYEALEFLIKNKYLICYLKKVNISKSGKTYDWVVEKMQHQIQNENNAIYPIWAWVKCYNGICPPKRAGTPVKGYDVKITFHKNSDEVFITDFRRFSFVLNNQYIPKNLKDKENFDNLLNRNGISLEDLKAYVRSDKYSSHRMDNIYLDICQKIRESFNRCITNDSDILQGCVWKIDLEDVEKIEILNNPNYAYGSINYIRSNGERMNWIEDFYKKL